MAFKESIYKSADGSWVAQIDIGEYENGQRKRKRFKGKRKADVVAKLDAFKKETMGLTMITDGGDVDVDDYVKSYLETYKKNKIKPASYARDYRTYYNSIRPYLGEYPIKKLTTSIIQNALINQLLSKGYKYSTVHKAYVLLKEALNKAIDEERITKNPCKGVVEPPKTTSAASEIKFLDDDEIKMFIKEAQKSCYKNGTAIASIIYTGLRGGELCALTWGDIDFDKRILRVEKDTSIVYDYSDISKPIRSIIEQNDTKNGKRRIVYLNKSAIALLKSIKPESCSPKDHVILYDGKNSAPSVDILSGSYSTIAENAGIKDKSGIHTLRHTCASLMIRKGVDIKIVSEMLGHSSVTFTYNTYVHLVEEQKMQAMNLLDDF